MTNHQLLFLFNKPIDVILKKLADQRFSSWVCYNCYSLLAARALSLNKKPKHHMHLRVKTY